jgi:hypothetical protein
MNNSLRLEKLETLMLIDPRQVVLHVLYDGDDEPTEADKAAAIEAYIQTFGDQNIIVLTWQDGIFKEWQRPGCDTRLVDAFEANLSPIVDILPATESQVIENVNHGLQTPATESKSRPLSQIESDDETLWTPIDI